MSRRITSATQLADLKKEAKRWLKLLRAGDPDAFGRLRRAIPSAPSAPTLRDIQLAIAREHGLPGWPALRAEIEAKTSNRTARLTIERYEQMARNLLDAFRSGTEAAMQRHWKDTWHRRSWQGMRRYVLADLGRPPDSQNEQADITPDDARYLVAREAGFESWAALSNFVSALPVGRRAPAAKPMRLFHAGSFDPDGEFDTTRDWDTAIERMQSGFVTGLDAQGQLTDDLLEEISRCDCLTYLRLGQSAAVSNDGLKHLARMPRLQRLDLSGCRIGDDGLSFLGELTALESLSLAGTRTTDAGVAGLSRCKRLHEVDLSWTPTGDGAIRALAGMNHLHRFCTGMAVSDAGLPFLSELPVFRSWRGGEPKMSLLAGGAGPNYLLLRGTFTNAGLAALTSLNGLFALDLHESRLRIDAECLRPLCKLPRLGWLGYQADDEAMSYIAAMPDLRFLLCQDTTATDEGFGALSQSRSLEYLWGGDCENLRDRGFHALATMPSLRALSVGCAHVSDSALARLPEFPALRELMPMGIPDEGFRHVGLCTGLESLILMYCRKTTDVATEHVGGLAKLSSYFASYTQITDKTPELLSRMDSLAKIELVGCAGVSNEGIAQLSRLPRLTELHLSGMQRVTREAVGSFDAGVRIRFAP